MRVDENAVGDVVNRLRRAEGQIRGVVAMLESGRDCTEVVTQLAAAARALDRAGFAIIASGLQQCFAAQAAGEDQRVDMKQLEKLFDVAGLVEASRGLEETAWPGSRNTAAIATVTYP